MVADGVLEQRLVHVADWLLEVDESDLSPSAFNAFLRIRDIKVAVPIISHVEIIPRDIGKQNAKAASLAVLDLLFDRVGQAMIGFGQLPTAAGP